jgi:iron complex outermembrane receptor protein
MTMKTLPRRTKRVLTHAIAIAGFLWGAPARADPAEPPPNAQPPNTGQKSETTLVSKGPPPTGRPSNIEDAALEGLLGLNLEDKLGKTEAVSRTNESVLRAPATITTLDSTQIRLSGATTVPDLLRFVPGVAVYRSAPNNDVVALRGTGGLAGNNIILLVDGIPINSPLDGTVNWDLIPLHVEDIERIEVVRGPVSPTYGANAYTGVVNIVTRTSAGVPPSYVARLRGGTDLDGKPKGAVSGRFLHIDKKMEFKWFVNAEHDATSNVPATPTIAAHEHRTDADRFSMTTAFGYNVTKENRFSVELGQTWSRRSSMEHLVLDSVPQSQRLHFGRVMYEMNDLAPAVRNVKLWMYGTSLRVNADRDAHTGLSYDGTKSVRGVAGADFVFRLHDSVDASVGGQGSIERMDASYLHPNADEAVRPSYGFYGGIKAAPASRLDLILTGRGDLAPISAKVEYSYRASAVYHADTWALRLTGASAFRNPTYVEAVGRFVDPANRLILLEGYDRIGAPRNTSVELGATFSPHTTLTVSPTLYLSRLTNLMVEDFESLVRRTFRNDTTPHTYAGGELEANWRVTDSLSVMPFFSVLHWLDTSRTFESNVAAPDQNSRFMGGARIHGVFGNERWGYGAGATVASPRSYNVRAGIPVTVLSTKIPTSVYLTAMIERQLTNSPAFWASLRVNAGLPGRAPESPLPLATPLGQSAILGLEVRAD